MSSTLLFTSFESVWPVSVVVFFVLGLLTGVLISMLAAVFAQARTREKNLTRVDLQTFDWDQLPATENQNASAQTRMDSSSIHVSAKPSTTAGAEMDTFQLPAIRISFVFDNAPISVEEKHKEHSPNENEHPELNGPDYGQEDLSK